MPGSTISLNHTLDLAFDQHLENLVDATVIRTQSASAYCAELGQWTDGLGEIEALYLDAPLASPAFAMNLRPSGIGCSVWLFDRCGEHCVRPDFVERLSSCPASAGMVVEKKKRAYALLQTILLDLPWRTCMPTMIRM